MIEFIYTIIAFILLWIPAFYLHELCHKFEALSQGCKSKISIWWNGLIPSMRCTITEGTLNDRWRFSLAGGFYSGTILIILSLILYQIEWLSISIGVLGFINLIYSAYEALYIEKLSTKEYMKYHYWVYLFGGIIGLIIYLLGHKVI